MDQQDIVQDVPGFIVSNGPYNDLVIPIIMLNARGAMREKATPARLDRGKSVITYINRRLTVISPTQPAIQ